MLRRILERFGAPVRQAASPQEEATSRLDEFFERAALEEQMASGLSVIRQAFDAYHARGDMRTMIDGDDPDHEFIERDEHGWDAWEHISLRRFVTLGRGYVGVVFPNRQPEDVARMAIENLPEHLPGRFGWGSEAKLEADDRPHRVVDRDVPVRTRYLRDPTGAHLYRLMSMPSPITTTLCTGERLGYTQVMIGEWEWVEEDSELIGQPRD